MKKVFKIIVCITVIFSLVMFSALSVSADNHNDFIVTKVTYAERNVDFTTYSISYSSIDNSLVQWYQPTGGYEGYVFIFNFPSNFVKGDVINLTGSLLLSDNATSIVFVLENLKSYSLTSNRVLKTINGETYYIVDFNITHTFTSNGTHTGRFVVYYSNSGLYMPMLGVKNLDFYINNDPQVALNEQTDALKQNQDKNASAIQQNQDKNTDKILNGDEDLDTSEQTGAIDGTTGGIDDAANNALGGKTDAEVQAEIDGALSGDIGLDMNKAGRISSFFDGLLDAFGADYKSLVLLSLSLGLAAFLIGRRYA